MRIFTFVIRTILSASIVSDSAIRAFRTKSTIGDLFRRRLSSTRFRVENSWRAHQCRVPKVATSVMAALMISGASVVARAQTYKVVGNGVYSYSPLVQGLDGNLYGAGYGIHGTDGEAGSIFRMTPGGKISTIYTFCTQLNCTDGVQPGGLVVATDGNIYGVTFQGGAYTAVGCNPDGTAAGCGTLFRITPAGRLTTLYNFCSLANCADGSLPVGPLIQATDGSLYGMTRSGGNTQDCTINSTGGCGTIFKISTTGDLTTRYAFCSSSGCPDGALPYANLVEGPDGNFYGTTAYGGGGAWYFNCLGCGTIFEITPQGKLTSLYSFCKIDTCPDGSTPEIGLTLATNGEFYGATVGAGAHGYGTIFSFTTSGDLTALYSFCSKPSCTDGEGSGALIQASDGDLYGYTPFGGTTDSGTLFKMTTSGTLTTIYNYPYCSQTSCEPGAFPEGTLLQDTSGIIYGSADVGSTGTGVIYSWTAPPLHRFVQALPVSGKAGTKVTILGNKLMGASAVTFNGTAAAFTVVSATEITTTVPSGATSGKVEITTPSGLISTYVVFRVI
jgi:uncharacterized repeat protein (TIGR03803 family)